MTTKTKNRLRALRHVALIAFACIAWCWAIAAAAQAPKKVSSPPPSPPAAKSAVSAATKEGQPEVFSTVFYLKYAQVAETTRMLQSVLASNLPTTGSITLVPDARLNALVFLGTPESARVVEELLRTLDQPAATRPSEPATQVRVYQIKHADPPMVLGVVISMFTGRPSLKAALDPKNNSIVMMASQEDLKTAAELIQTLDVPKAGRGGAGPGAACQFRIVWLASGLSSKDMPAPADDLKQVVEQLGGFGVKDVRQVGQVVVNTLADGQFQTKCSPLFEGESAELSVDGKLAAKTEPLQLSLRIAAKQRKPNIMGAPRSRGPQDDDLVNLETVICPRFDGSYVVLGVAPVGKVTSIFVVQATQRPER